MKIAGKVQNLICCKKNFVNLFVRSKAQMFLRNYDKISENICEESSHPKIISWSVSLKVMEINALETLLCHKEDPRKPYSKALLLVTSLIYWSKFI